MVGILGLVIMGIGIECARGYFPFLPVPVDLSYYRDILSYISVRVYLVFSGYSITLNDYIYEHNPISSKYKTPKQHKQQESKSPIIP